ncbi:MAG: aldehyde dehydrogenase family protein, partial [Sphingomonadaceae bacterium]
MSVTEIISTEPATGVELWRGAVGDAAHEVALARAAWPAWASQPLAVRTETLRRFADRVKAEGEALADLIAR